MFFLKSLPTRTMVERYFTAIPAHDRANDGSPERVLQALSMMRSASLLIRKVERHFSAHDVSQLKFLVLVVIDREAVRTGLRHSEVGDRIDVSKPVLSRVIRSLVGEGLLSEAKDAYDARSLRLRITRAGKDKLADVLPGYFEIIDAHMYDVASDDPDTVTLTETWQASEASGV